MFFKFLCPLTFLFNLSVPILSSQICHPTQLTCKRYHRLLPSCLWGENPHFKTQLGSCLHRAFWDHYPVRGHSYEELTPKHLRCWEVMALPPCSLILICEPHARACGLLCSPLRYWPLDPALRCWHQPSLASCFPLVIIP